MRGRDVRQFQRILRKRGFRRIVADGAFGARTERAVRRLQSLLGLPVTGVVDSATFTKVGVKVRISKSGTTPAPPAPTGDYPLAGPNAASAKYLKVFPVAGRHRYSNDFGAPRSQGSHQGNDIMADRGVPLRAVADGSIKRLTRSETGLGGLWVWFTDTAGNEYYYAHMDTVAADLTVGMSVAAGHVLGTVGNTGDARYGAPHLHFEIHPGGGPAVNPYTDLLAVDPEPPTG
jgi:murein DD-endopeptidase MepM/ murein hydrolase activator NlpD